MLGCTRMVSRGGGEPPVVSYVSSAQDTYVSMVGGTTGSRHRLKTLVKDTQLRKQDTYCLLARLSWGGTTETRHTWIKDTRTD